MGALGMHYMGWNRRSGKKRFHSIGIPAVAVNQIAATTGAVVRNFFMGTEGGEGAVDQRGETVTLASSSVSFPLVN